MTDLEYYRSKAGKTIGTFVSAVLSIDNPADASRFYLGHLTDIHEQMMAGTWTSKCSPEQGARANIGWCFGEGMMPERVKMWSECCGASHPVFGVSNPSPQQAFEAGLRLGSAKVAEQK